MALRFALGELGGVAAAATCRRPRTLTTTVSSTATAASASVVGSNAATVATATSTACVSTTVSTSALAGRRSVASTLTRSLVTVSYTHSPTAVSSPLVRSHVALSESSLLWKSEATVAQLNSHSLAGRLWTGTRAYATAAPGDGDSGSAQDEPSQKKTKKEGSESGGSAQSGKGANDNNNSYSADGGGGGEEGGFFSTFVNRFSQEMKQVKEVQEVQESVSKTVESLKSSDALKRAKEKASTLSSVAAEKTKTMSGRLTEEASKAAQKSAKVAAKAYDTTRAAAKEFADSEVGKKAAERGAKLSKTVGKATSVAGERIASTTSRISEKVEQTGVFDKVEEKTSTLEKSLEQLLPPEYRNKPAPDVSPEDYSDSTAIVKKEVGEWEQRWNAIKSSPVVKSVSNIKKKFDESDNRLVALTRDITYKTKYFVSDWSERLVPPSPTAHAVSVIREFDPNFRIERFLEKMRIDTIPQTLKACASGDVEEVKRLTTGSAYAQVEATIREFEKQQLKNESSLLDVREVDLMSAEVTNSGHILVGITFKTQEVEVIRDASGAVVLGDPDNIQMRSYVWIMQLHDLDATRWLVADTAIHEVHSTF